MNKLKTALLLLAIFTAAVFCSFLFETDYRKLIRYLYELTSGGKISFIVPKKYLYFGSFEFVLSFSLFTTGLCFLLLKKTGKQIILTPAFALILFTLSVITQTWLDGLFKLIECTACDDGTRMLAYNNVNYNGIFISSLFIAFLPALITEIKRFIKEKKRLP